jgi:hypothetical protein
MVCGTVEVVKRAYQHELRNSLGLAAVEVHLTAKSVAS